MDTTEISHFGYAAKFFRRHFFDRRKHRGHGVVDPNVDRADLAFDLFRRCFHFFGIGNIDTNRKRSAAEFLHVLAGCFQSIRAAREQGDRRAIPGKSPRQRPPHPGGGSGDDDDFRLLVHRRINLDFATA